MILIALYSARIVRRLRFTPVCAPALQLHHQPLQQILSLQSNIPSRLDSAIYSAKLIFRLLRLGFLYLPALVTLPLYFISSYRVSNWWLGLLIRTIEQSGAAFVKLGQWASTRNDLLNDDICRYLQKLQSNVRPHSAAYTIALLESTFGLPLSRIFIEFDPVPIGVGAIAQVYRGVLSQEVIDKCSSLDASMADKNLPSGIEDDGQIESIVLNSITSIPKSQVAIKVLHPNVEQQVEIDLDILFHAAKWIEYIFHEATWFSLSDNVLVFGSMMRSQLDLKTEATNLAEFSFNFNNWGHVGFPSPILPLCSDNFLFETYIDALPLDPFLSNGPTPFDVDIATLGLTSFLKMLLLDNKIHADLHPGIFELTFGNILISFHHPSLNQFLDSKSLSRIRSINGIEWRDELADLDQRGYRPYVYFVDAGLCSTLSPTLMTNFIDLFGAITKFDGDLVGNLMIERSKSPTQVIDPTGFKSSMHHFIQKVKERTFVLKVFETNLRNFQ